MFLIICFSMLMKQHKQIVITEAWRAASLQSRHRSVANISSFSLRLLVIRTVILQNRRPLLIHYNSILLSRFFLSVYCFPTVSLRTLARAAIKHVFLLHFTLVSLTYAFTIIQFIVHT